MFPALARRLDSIPSSAVQGARPSLAKAAQQTAIVRALLDQLEHLGNDDDLRSQIADELNVLGRRLIDIAGTMADHVRSDQSGTDLIGEQSGIIRTSGLR